MDRPSAHIISAANAQAYVLASYPADMAPPLDGPEVMTVGLSMLDIDKDRQATRS